jgi:hypothetical protein
MNSPAQKDNFPSENQRLRGRKVWRKGWDYPKLRFGSGVRAPLLTRAPKAPHQSNCVRISPRIAHRLQLSEECMSINRMAEGVGFEPTVGFKPTLDFESSALNRTQPPFLGKRKRPTLNVQYRTSNAMLILTLGRWVLALARSFERANRRRANYRRLTDQGSSSVLILANTSPARF